MAKSRSLLAALSVGVLGVVILSSGLGTGSSTGATSDPAASTLGQSFFGDGYAREQRRLDRERTRRESPEGKSERDASRSRFHDLSSSDALQTGRDELPALFDGVRRSPVAAPR